MSELINGLIKSNRNLVSEKKEVESTKFMNNYPDMNSRDVFENMIRENIQVSYVGPFDSQVLAVLAKNIELSMSEDPKINKKMFKIFIELAQNIAFYSAERVISQDGNDSGCGIILIQEYEDYYMFATGNLATNDNLEPVLDKCKTINSLSREDLREYKRQQRNLPPSKKGGGNIGLIQVALTADNYLDYNVIKISEDQSFYIVGVKLSKNCINSD